MLCKNFCAFDVIGISDALNQHCIKARIKTITASHIIFTGPALQLHLIAVMVADLEDLPYHCCAEFGWLHPPLMLEAPVRSHF